MGTLLLFGVGGIRWKVIVEVCKQVWKVLSKLYTDCDLACVPAIPCQHMLRGILRLLQGYLLGHGHFCFCSIYQYTENESSLEVLQLMNGQWRYNACRQRNFIQLLRKIKLLKIFIYIYRGRNWKYTINALSHTQTLALKHQYVCLKRSTQSSPENSKGKWRWSRWAYRTQVVRIGKGNNRTERINWKKRG